MTADNLKKFLTRRSVSRQVLAIKLTTPLFSTGLLDSVSMVELIAFVETEADVRVDFADVTLENFDTMERILRFANG